MEPDDRQLEELEQALQRLSPAEPDEALTARIFAAFETPPDAAPAAVEQAVVPAEKPVSWFQPFAAAAAVVLIAGVIAIVGLNRPAGETPETVNKFVPAHAQNTYRGSEIGEIVFDGNSQPMQAVRHQFTDTYTWENPADGSRVEIEVPVERVRYVPLHTD